MIKKVIAWVAAATVALVVGLPGTAEATVVWKPASCATGSFDPVSVDPLGHYLLPVHMTLCEPNQEFNYSIVMWTAPERVLPVAYGNKLVSYRQVSVIADVFPKTPRPLFALCLMRDIDTRTACVRVDTAADGIVTSTPIDATDPLVADDVYFMTYPPVIWPNYCSTCVTISI